MTNRFLILGAGLIGASLGFELARRKAQVTILDAGLPANAASGRSFGWINASFFLNEDHFHLRHAAMAAHRRLERDLPDSGHLWTGTLWWEETGEAFDQTAATLTRLGYDLNELSAREIAAREPALGQPPARALHFPAEGAVDAAHLTHHLLDAAAALGAEVWSGCPALRLMTDGDRVTGAATPMGRIEADQTILAIGNATPALLASAGLHLPMLSRPGLILRTRPLPPLVNHILASPDQEVRQDATGALLAPASASHQSDKTEAVTESPGDLARATLARLSRLLPGANLQPAAILHADRPVPGDGLPVVGPITVRPGLALAVLHSGVTLAPLVTASLADELTGQGAHALLAPFRSDRLLSPL
ncbi:FAD-binding oxidoreductase [Frigidibacter sp. RF13]|uniref:NAD(P)/FAD-dependent oxidoreductase n=1 Tax=Frigidibacter sp. RF13 TaxID=2997340 RepID=UPI002270B0AA|nr:FAD-binding oxidoreductase [Frigidibacter sp. RF13]MCY1127230.1 FAD-binding oxidoreductase [Frigidibacter sp. RF13]